MSWPRSVVMEDPDHPKIERKLRGKSTFLLGLFFLIITPLSAELKDWTGSGSDTWASNPQNWSGETLPQAGDQVRFGSAHPTQDCRWDLSLFVSQFEITSDYSGTIYAQVDMGLGDVLLDGGTFHMGSYEHTLSGDFIHTGGQFTTELNGTVRFNSSSPQHVSMMVTPLGANQFQSHFFNFRVAASDVLSAQSDLIVDGSFSISAGQFSLGGSTMVMTGGAHVNAGAGEKFNWSSAGGQFIEGSGQIRFFSLDRDYRMDLPNGNAVHNLLMTGTRGVEMLSPLTVKGNLLVTPLGSQATFDLGELFSHEVYGDVQIGPSISPAAPTMTTLNNDITIHGDLVVQMATLSVGSSFIEVLGDELWLKALGTLHLYGASPNQISLAGGSEFKSTGGTLLNLGSSRLTSVSGGDARYAVVFQGTLDVRTLLEISFTDANGFWIQENTTLLNLKNLSFSGGLTGGVALQFDPVPQSDILLEAPQFDLTIDSNIRAILDPDVVPSATIDVVNPEGVRSSPDYEIDPHEIINWGILGTPQNFHGVTLGANQIRWDWEVVNNPLNFVVRDDLGTQLSVPLEPDTTTWLELGLSPDTAYTRYVEASADAGTLNSNMGTQTTWANPPTSPIITDVRVSSLTLSWDSNGNPAHTLYVVERDSGTESYAELVRGIKSDIHPVIDTGLDPFRSYRYRIKAENGNGIPTAYTSPVQAITLPRPPPVITDIHPSSAPNLGEVSFEITGHSFAQAVHVEFRMESGRVLFPSDVGVQSPSTITGTIDLTGAYATQWDVLIYNSDGKHSYTSGLGIFTVENAQSTPQISIGDYNPSLPFLFESPKGKTRISMDPGAASPGRLYVSENPKDNPIDIDPDLIARATQALQGWELVPGTLREILFFNEGGIFKGHFMSPVTLHIDFPDVDANRIVDSVDVRIENLKIMTLNEQKVEWEDIPQSYLEVEDNKIRGVIEHFSVYAIFGALPNADLIGIHSYPNPWRPGSGGSFDSAYVTFMGLSSAGSIRIFSIDGILVRTLTYESRHAGMLEWDGTSQEGSPVASGVYLVEIEASTGSRRFIKLGVER